MEERARSKKRHEYVVLAILIHGILTVLLVVLGTRLPVGSLGIIGGVAFIAILFGISISYIRKFGREPVGHVRTGSLGLGRVDVLLAGMSAVGYIVLLGIIGPGLPPGSFLWFFLGFWVLFVAFLIIVVIAARNIRREALGRIE